MPQIVDLVGLGQGGANAEEGESTKAKTSSELPNLGEVFTFPL